MPDYKYRIPAKIVAIIDLVVTILSIWLLVVFFLFALLVTSCVVLPKDTCRSFSFGPHAFGETKSSSSATTTRMHCVNGQCTEETVTSDNANLDLSQMFEGFGRKIGEGESDEIDRNRMTDAFSGAFSRNNRNWDPNPNPNRNDPFGSNSNSNFEFGGFKEDGFGTFQLKDQDDLILRPRPDFLQTSSSEEQKRDEEMDGLMRVFFIIMVVILWTVFAIAVLVEVIVLIAAVRLLLATNEGKNPAEARRSANCWRVCTCVLLVIFVLNVLGGTGRSSLVDIGLSGLNLLFRIAGVVIVSLYIRELEEAEAGQGQQGQQVYYDLSGGAGGQGQKKGDEDGGKGQGQIGWAVPNQV